VTLKSSAKESGKKMTKLRRPRRKTIKKGENNLSVAHAKVGAFQGSL